MITDKDKDDIFKFMFKSTRPMCRTCCYWLNSIALLLDFSALGFKFEEKIKKDLTNEDK